MATLSNMPEDQPLSKDGRLSSLEQAIDDLRSQNRTNGSLLQTMLSKLGASNQIPPPPHHCICTFPPPAGQKGFSFKPSLPLAFNGDRTMGKAFLTSCRIFIRLCPGAFKDEVTKMVWAMSYMNIGRAAKWVSRELEQEAMSGQLRFLDWKGFEDAFQKDFTPLNSEATAVNVLEGTTYFQQNRTVDDYLDQFRDLVCESGYTVIRVRLVQQ